MPNKKKKPPLPLPTGRAEGNGKIHRTKLSPEESKLQGAAMLALRTAENRTQAEIAQIFRVDPRTVAKRLAEARAGDLSELGREIIAERMLPMALTLLENELRKGNFDAAKDVLYGMQVLQKGGKATIEHLTSNSPTLEAIRKERAKAIEAEILPPQDTAADGSSSAG